MIKVRIDFSDLGRERNKLDLYLYKVLSERFELELSDQPDFLVYGHHGYTHRLHTGVRICYSTEANLPDFNRCDYSIGSVRCDDPRHLELPVYVIVGDAPEAIKRHDDPRQILAARTRFCSFVVSGYNPRNNENRVAFFHKLSRYKKVDSGGKVLNNIGGPVPGGARGKIDFLRAYKFNIAYENRSRPGYTSEKIFQPMIARSLPIYWGDPTINEQFNPRSFLNRADFASDEALIEKIIELDNDDEKYLEYLRQPYFYDDQPNRFFDHGRVLDFFERIFTQKITPVARKKGKWPFLRRCFGRWILVKRHHDHQISAPGW